MTNEQIEISLGKLVRTERRLTGKILNLINLVDERKIYLERGFSSLFEFLTKYHGYSEPAANRRISAARLLRNVPDGTQKIESGALNLTTLTKAHTAIRAKEKFSRMKFSREEKSRIVESIEMKSTAQTERTLISLLPESNIQFEKKTLVSQETSRLVMSLSNETIENLERIKELLSHVMPKGASFADVIEHIAKDFLKRKDPLQKPDKKLDTSSHDSAAPAKTRVTVAAAKRCVRKSIPAQTRREVMKRDQGRCQFKDSQTGRTCDSRYQIQLDHIYPKSLGGEDTAENLRCLCRKHNLHVAEMILGGRGP